VACSAPIRGSYLLAPGRRLKDLPTALLSQASPKGPSFCLLTPASSLSLS